MSDSEDFQPLRKRFKSPVKKEELEDFSKGYVPANTKKNTSWAVNIFEEWKENRNKMFSDEAEQCPMDVLETGDVGKLNFWLSRFVWNKKGDCYPPKTIQQILAGLQRKALEATPTLPRFLDRKNAIYVDLHKTCDSVYRQLRYRYCCSPHCHFYS